MSTVNIEGANVADFIMPDEERPKQGPLYAVNTTKSRIVFSAKRDFPAFSFGPYPAQDSIHQIPIDMLDTVEFMRLWASGKLAVSKNSNVAIAHTTIEREKAIADKKREADVKASIEKKGASKAFEVKQSDSGLPVVVEAKPEFTHVQTKRSRGKRSRK